MTTAENFRRVRNLFDAAMERPAGERAAFLDDACHGDDALRAEVDALLQAREHPETWIDRPALGPTDRMEGRRVGPYEILRQIASGGMGTVYLARRADGAFEKRVAVKILRPETASPEVLRRFQQERDILAALDHPNIARILDGGQTPEGLPYLAMEFIDGAPIDRYSEEHHLDVNERLRLFRPVCAAVRFAHQHGVVHRDLKPSNILVTADGVPKLLDFGISKVLAAGADESTACVTRTGLWLMTPEYASPEQVRGEASGAPTDVYSLGVVLYELLTGQRPYRLRNRVFHEVVRVICEEPPTRPSAAATAAWKRRLAGDLDAVLLKALEKQPGRRYRSVQALDSEIGRFLEGEPVEARRPLPVEMAQRAVRRYSGVLMGLLVLVTLLVSGAIQVQPFLIPFFAGLGLTLLVMWFAQSRDLGVRTTSRLFRDSSGVLIVAGALGVLLVFSIPKAARPGFFTVIHLGLMAAIAYILARWPFRERWAGRLIVDLGRRRAPWLYALLLLGVAGCVGPILRGSLDERSLAHTAGTVQILLLTFWMFLLYPRAEVRERGIVNMGQLIPWHRIEARSWDDSHEQTVILRLQCGGFRRIMPSVPVVVPARLKEQAEAAIERNLREWPGQ